MVKELKSYYTELINNSINELKNEKNIDAEIAPIEGEIPPKEGMGDYAFPMFSFSKQFHLSPNAIAEEVKRIALKNSTKGDEIKVQGPYVNIYFNKDDIYKSLVKDVENPSWGKNSHYKGQKIMIEFSCPNTNKPLHLGHMRNDAIGESVSSLLKESGAEVLKVNLVNDRGVHICKSMLAYQKFGGNDTPESTGIKGDHFVGDYYVKFNTWQTESTKDENKTTHPTPDEMASSMLEKWESEDKDTLELWNKMRTWTLDGIGETYKRTGIKFDKYYYESQLYKKGKSEILRGLEKGIFYKDKDGAIKVSLAPIGLDEKVLLRSDGTSIYITQDIGTAIERHNDWPYTSCIYVVGNEQEYHFKVLFYILSLLGYPWSKNLYHLSYGMVNLPNGRMKSREGTVVDADDLLDRLHSLSLSSIKAERNLTDEKANDIAEKVALAALNYFLLSASPSRDMIFDINKSLEFQGNTGPYLQYMGARVSAILRQAGDEGIKDVTSFTLTENEKKLVALLDDYPNVVEKAAIEKDPSILATYLYSLSSTFSKWYHDEPILKAEGDLRTLRLNISIMFKKVLEKAFTLLHIPFLEEM